VALSAASRLGGMMAMGVLALSPAAAAGERVPVTGAPVTVEVPDGWVVAPITADMPLLGLTLCDPARSDRNSCSVLGEMQVSQLTGARAPASLDAQQAALQVGHDKAPQADRLLAPRRMQVGARDALESAEIGQVHYNYGAGKGGSWHPMVHHMVMVQDGQVFYRCSLSATKVRYGDRLRDDLRRFCSSIQFTGDARPTGKS
jgi:hypothetical protein